MGEKKGKGFLSKFVSVLSGKPSPDAEGKPTSSSGKFAPVEKEPFDLAFVKRFTDSGGKFLYCEEAAEMHSFLKHISAESGLHEIFCRDENCQSILKKLKLPFSTKNSADTDAFLTPCEYLISYNGSIMLTQNQTIGIKYSELPEVFVVLASTSQIVENLRTGLTGIRNKYPGNLPGQITSLKGPKDNDIQQQPSATSTCKKDVYLILLEDQL